MGERLLIAVMGHRNSGKRKTWNTLFERTVKTGKRPRRLYLNEAQWIDNVFLVGESPEERGVPVKQLLPQRAPRIVLSSVQYRQGVDDTFNFFLRRGYDVFVQWLNPGYSDRSAYPTTSIFRAGCWTGGHCCARGTDGRPPRGEWPRSGSRFWGGPPIATSSTRSSSQGTAQKGRNRAPIEMNN